MLPHIQNVLESLGEGNLYECGKLQHRGALNMSVSTRLPNPFIQGMNVSSAV
jgi:hypothetical protein